MKIAGICLATGSSQRMGEAKLSSELSLGIPLGSQVLREMRACGLSSLKVVVRPDDPLLWLYDRKDKDRQLSPYRIVPCKQAQLDMAHSIRSGVEALRRESPDAMLIVRADQPFVTEDLLRRLISVYLHHPSIDYVVSGQGNVEAPPVLISKSVFPLLAELEGDNGVRSIFHSPAYKGIRMSHIAELACMDVDTLVEMEIARTVWSELHVKAKPAYS